MRTSSTGNDGFTLVELIVVVAIIAVLAGMTVPRLLGPVERMQLRVPARHLLAMARYARDYAATRGCECRLEIDQAAGQYALRAASDPNRPDEFTPLRTTEVKPGRLARSIRFGRIRISSPGRHEQADAARCVTFRPDGRCDAAIIEITDGRRTYSLVILPDTGRPKLVTGTVAEPPDERLDLDA
jgi:type II secretion system protein H